MRKLASLRTITEIRPIEGADAIECAIIDGAWHVVVKKGEFKANDLAVYFEIDSWIPHELAPFLSKGKEPRVFQEVRGEKLRTVRLRGQLSQGLLLPIDVLKDIDLSIALGVNKYEPPINAQLQGLSRSNFPGFIPKTDLERCQNLKGYIFEQFPHDEYDITIKLDGSSMTVYLEEDELRVCSRNIDLKETEGNAFWMAARKQNLETKIKLISAQYFDGRPIALQGELIGEKIQGNPEKLTGQAFYLFDIYDIQEAKYEGNTKFIADAVDLLHVPVIKGKAKLRDLPIHDLDGLLKLADGNSLNPNTAREGLVFKSHNRDFRFKVISNEYLLKEKE